MIVQLHSLAWTRCIAGCCLFLCGGRGFADEVTTVDFENQVAPILIRNCLECHQPRNRSGGLALDTASAIATGGETGAAVATDSAKSLLMQRVSAGEMPPPQHGESRALAESDIEILRQWIDAGANFPAERRLDIYERTNDVRGGREPVAGVAPAGAFADEDSCVAAHSCGEGFAVQPPAAVMD